MGGGEETGLGTAPGQTPRPSGSSPPGPVARHIAGRTVGGGRARTRGSTVRQGPVTAAPFAGAQDRT